MDYCTSHWSINFFCFIGIMVYDLLDSLSLLGIYNQVWVGVIWFILI